MASFNDKLLGSIQSIADCLAEPEGYLEPIEQKLQEIIALLKSKGARLP